MDKARIELHLSNGKQHTFHPKSAADMLNIVSEIKSSKFFQKNTVLFAADQYLVHIQTKFIELVYCFDPSTEPKNITENEEDILEISRDDLLRLYLELPEAEKYSSRLKTPGEFMTTFLEIHTEGQREIFLSSIRKKEKAWKAANLSRIYLNGRAWSFDSLREALAFCGLRKSPHNLPIPVQTPTCCPSILFLLNDCVPDRNGLSASRVG